VKRKLTRAQKKGLLRYHFGDEASRAMAAMQFEHLVVQTQLQALEQWQKQKDENLVRPMNRIEPPAVAEFLFLLFVDSERAESIQGCLNERFSGDCASFGCARARRRYWASVIRSLWPLLRRAVAHAVKWAAVLSALKRLIG
jgi:hypothetical protein